MKKIALALAVLFAICGPKAWCDEGMWIPSLISAQIGDMRSKGFKLSAEDIYSISQASLKDAVVLFGGGCTGEIISEEGLLLTNHHCGYGQIQSHSSTGNDILTNGFWAMDRKEELPNPGLSVSLLVSMEDVTPQVLAGVDERMNEAERKLKIEQNIAGLIKDAVKDTHYYAAVEPYYYGNQYFMFVYERYTDVRLVGAPPSSIGKFGGDTDNWMWPRHTGDFSLFRIYAGKDNKPAAYSPDNVPYKPKKSLTISTSGVREGDFTLIYGYPGRTTQYILSDDVEYILSSGNPHKTALRTMRLDIMNDEMSRDADTRIAYASKNASVANSWKKWQGESKGLARLGTIDKKRKQEAEFSRWAAGTPYADLLPEMKRLYAELAPYAFVRDYYNEAYKAMELPQLALRIAADIRKGTGNVAAANAFFKNYSNEIDRRTSVKMLSEYLENVPEKFIPEYVARQVATHGGVEKYIEYLYRNTVLASAERTVGLLAKKKDQQIKIINNDHLLKFAEAFEKMYNDSVSNRYISINGRITTLYRTYLKALMEMRPQDIRFPDANLTLRVAYGNVEGYSPMDAVHYTPISTLDGVMEKDDPEIYDYDVPQRLRELYNAREFGVWEVNGTVPVCFLATNHTTGGNSGSPVLNSYGELVGINFDRTWESTMSDIEFDPVKCRNIAVDIRYILFIIDKIGGAGYLLDEMKFAVQ